MCSRVNLWVACGVVLVGSLCASSAQAQIFGGGGGGYGLGFFNYGGNTGQYFERIPYYALYPPVYYSNIVPRPYGYSPFAYPPGTMTPDVAPSAAATDFINPYVPRGDRPATETPVSDKTVRTARTYINPFVQTPLTPGASEPSLARRGER